MKSVGLLRNGILGQYARAAAAVAKSHHSGVYIQVDIVLCLQVAVVSNSRQLRLRIRQSRERERLAVGCRNSVAFALCCREREGYRLLMVAARLRTRIVYILLWHAACPSADGCCLKTVYIAVLQSPTIP